MNAKTLTALKGSIDKWQKIVDGTGVDDGALNCPLCRLFDDTCEKCPVAIKSGKSNCDNTPYPKWRDHQKSIHYASDDWTVKCCWCRQFAEEELEFLKGLLPRKKART